ncbi:hypothetical protein EUBVEN_01856 [Eubacterium ventriosum ATCC 27560]|uniref:Uncharacterized protein n=1 Tax=Eubacterium ventriosum ATCC 27560 TaxID=411463 RepID=A5Z816_9FIRM|nr:hypothetical protein EUBVEN_01856 [Eubacterium ventriosum ATCC 27560]
MSHKTCLTALSAALYALFLYLTNNRINLLCTGISLHTLQIISLFLQQPVLSLISLILPL